MLLRFLTRIRVQEDVVHPAPYADGTPQVQAAVLDEIADESIIDCEDVTSGHLKEITVLRLGGKGITELQVGDFEGLDNLEALFLFKNPLETLPDGVFANLGKLELLDLGRQWITRAVTRRLRRP